MAMVPPGSAVEGQKIDAQSCEPRIPSRCSPISPDYSKFLLALSAALAIALALSGINQPAVAFEAAGAASERQTGILALRGAVLPFKASSTLASEKAPVKLASLGNSARSSAAGGIIPRLNFGGFRFSFKPARGQKTKARRGRKGAGHVKLTSLDHKFVPSSKKRGGSFDKVARGYIKWKAYPGCVPVQLKRILVKVSKKFGGVTVNSTHRSHSYNRKIGGARHSYHLSCQAVDFRLHGKYRSAMAYLKKQPQIGGLKHYGGGLFHIDIGPRRTW